jgi:putative PIN family toxin of toxin-antitoxin system
MVKAVIDTNCLVASISPRSPHHWLYDAFKKELFQWAVSNEILTEYEEIISKRYSAKAADFVISTLLVAPNVTFNSPYFRWQLIENDLDDNKFVDVYVSSNADFLVSHDSDFNVLKFLEFPKINVVSLNQFKISIQDVSNR